MRLVLLGAPGAGKGTQAELLFHKLGIPTVSTGNILREAIAEGTEIGRRAKILIDDGQLVPDDVIMTIVRERLARPDCAGGYILDGVPRTVEQAQALIDLGIEIDHVLSLEVEDAKIEARMTGRRVCTACGASFHLVANPPKIDGVCDECGASLTVRADDAPETVRHRLQVYHARTEALKSFYRELGKLRLVRGDRSIDETHREILEILGV